jgi:hypothetical protein
MVLGEPGFLGRKRKERFACGGGSGRDKVVSPENDP